MSRYYWNLNDVKKCWRFFSVLLEHYDLQFKEAEFYIDYLLYVKDYQTMLEFLTNSKDNYNDFFVLHYQGVANLALGNYKKALLYFYQSLSFCTDSIANKIKKIKKINSYIENT